MRKQRSIWENREQSAGAGPSGPPNGRKSKPMALLHRPRPGVGQASCLPAGWMPAQSNRPLKPGTSQSPAPFK